MVERDRVRNVARHRARPSAANADGRLEVVYTAPGGALDHAWQTAPNSTWSGASALGGAARTS